MTLEAALVPEGDCQMKLSQADATQEDDVLFIEDKLLAEKVFDLQAV